MKESKVEHPMKAKDVKKNEDDQKGSGDELVIISTSMVIASLAADTTLLSMMLDGLFGQAPAIWLMIWGMPVWAPRTKFIYSRI